MPFHSKDGLRYYTFDLLNDAPIVHAVFTRRGGTSPFPWAELNLGASVGDAIENVAENRRRIFQALGRPVESLYDVWQVHSADVVCTRAPRGSSQHQKADAIVTDSPQITLFMRFADCVPILLYDPIHSAVGLVHAGWLGTVKRIVSVAVQAMQAAYQSKPDEVLACIGPSIGYHHYPVGSEVVGKVQEAFGEDASRLLHNHEGEVQFDLWEANHWLLNQSGVNQVEIAGICTACHPEDWFSHRAEHGQTGRFGVLIGLV